MAWMPAMLLFIPISIALSLFRVPQVWVFLTSGLAIIPLAGYLGIATEEFARYRGQGIGGLLNATFGNATELIIALVALTNGQVEVVKYSLIGSIIGNVLLVLGCAVFLGGLRYKTQTFNKDMASMHAAMLSIAVVSLLVPALFVRSAALNESAADHRIMGMSLSVSAVLLVMYIGSLIFSLRTHEDLFRGGEEAEIPQWKQATAVLVLLVSSLLVAVESELLVHSIEPAVASLHMNKVFLGVIVLPIIGNAAEHSSAITMALRNKMDISLNIAISSSTQIAMFIAPLVVFVSVLIGRPTTLLFSNIELVGVTAAVFITALVAQDGKSHWLEGAQLIAAYVIVAIAFFFVGR